MNGTRDLSAFHIAIGHATDDAGATGLTVIRGIDGPMRAGVAVFGRATGTRELLTASADHLVAGRIDAILLTGGSAYGLDACAGVMRWMEERGRGFSVGGGVVPIIPAAVVFDLGPLGHFDARPTAQMAYDATERASASDIPEGAVGAGTGTTVGKMLGTGLAMKGGFGWAIESSADRTISVAACAVVNALGDVRSADGDVLAGARTAHGGFANAAELVRRGTPPNGGKPLAMQNTTLAVVASNVSLSAVHLTQLARTAGAAFFRRITPAGSSSDGDVIFAVSPIAGQPADQHVMMIESLAVAALEQAIERAVTFARGRDGIPGLADNHGH